MAHRTNLNPLCRKIKVYRQRATAVHLHIISGSVFTPLSEFLVTKFIWVPKMKIHTSVLHNLSLLTQTCSKILKFLYGIGNKKDAYNSDHYFTSGPASTFTRK